MDNIPDELTRIAESLDNGETPSASVRDMLSWFGFHRRGWRQVQQVHSAFEQLNLETSPDFEGAYIDTLIQFKKQQSLPTSESTAAGVPLSSIPVEQRSVGDSLVGTDAAFVSKRVDPTHRIGRLASANKPPMSVAPDAALAEAVTLMLQNDFSQLPVMTNERTVKGMISWKSVGSRLALARVHSTVRDYMDSHQELNADNSLFDAIGLIVRYEAVLIRDLTQRISGIVTTSDISLQFNQLAEPFLLLAEIENHVRSLIAPRFSKEELRAAADPSDTEHTIEDVADLNFGGYVRLLENAERWQKLGIDLDRRTFVKSLDKIRGIRNDVMHFDPDPIEQDDLIALRNFATFLERLQRLRG